MFATTDSQLIQLRLRTAEATLAYYRGDWPRAAETLADVRSDYRVLGLVPELWQVQRVLGWCWARLGHVLGEQAALAEDSNTLLAEMSHSLPPADRPFFLGTKWTSEEEYLASLVDQLSDVKERLRASPWYKRPWIWWSMARQLARLLQQIDRHKQLVAKEVIGGTGPDQIAQSVFRSVRRLLNSAARKHATISFLVLPDRVLVVLRRRYHVDFAVSPVSRISLQDLVARWHRIMSEGISTGGEEIVHSRQIGEQLANHLQLSAILRGLPRHITSLTFIPDDVLHGFPFAALVYEREYLLEKFAITIGFEHDARQSHSVRLTHPVALLVGVSTGTPDVPPLPGARREVEQVRQWLSRFSIRVHTLVDEAADKSTIFQEMAESCFVHLACHGVFLPDAPDKSGLILIPRPQTTETLSLCELGGLNLKMIQHVTLSSCWGADNFILPGRRLVSLPETLWRGGAESILGCLWRVDDDFSAVFVRRFYTYLETMPRDQALQQTQIDCLRGRLSNLGKGWEHPIYWSGYRLYGNFGPLEVAQHAVTEARDKRRPCIIEPRRKAGMKNW